MKKQIILLSVIALAVASCGTRSSHGNEGRVVTVTIPPFAWFVEQIGGDDFKVNVLLPPGADHHIWEPLPAQISALSGSEAFIMNGQLGFEHAWMDRFRQVNPDMKVLDLSRNIQLIWPRHPSGIGVSAPLNAEPQSEGLIRQPADEGLKVGGDESSRPVTGGVTAEDTSASGHQHEGNESFAEGDGEDHQGHAHGGPDPHYWMSPVAARIMARDIRDFLAELNPSSTGKYDANLAVVNRKIADVDSVVRAAVDRGVHKTVLIYHPALAYMGRDYGFEQVSFEDEGKNPSPARMKELIDLARVKEIKIIFIQAEYDVRNAQSLSRETGTRLVVINPMNPEWPEAVIEVARALGGRDFRF